MKIERQLPSVSAIQPQERRPALRPEGRTTQVRQADSRQSVAERMGWRSGNYSIQLNRQLSSMQLAESYLADLAGRLSQLKLSLSRLINSTEPEDKAAAQQLLREAVALLRQRSERTGGALDARFRLSLNEPPRIRFTLQGLESIQAIQRSGAEILVFSGGRQLPEPLAVVLEDGLSEQQILRRFNTGLSQAGLRAELDENGRLLFSAREADWLALKDHLTVQGGGKLLPQERTWLESWEEQLLHLPEALGDESAQELRRMLDQVLSALDQIALLREQLRRRQQEIREFLARHADDDEKARAESYAGRVFQVMNRRPSSYASVMQVVLAQANLSRYAVVSLLS
ncbi:MAG: hypothetical protein GX093_10635 [Xanthomonadaceae bacterium]|nr:hypothetical protein [Xanthomonadaceae bacterium]